MGEPPRREIALGRRDSLCLRHGIGSQAVAVFVVSASRMPNIAHFFAILARSISRSFTGTSNNDLIASLLSSSLLSPPSRLNHARYRKRKLNSVIKASGLALALNARPIHPRSQRGSGTAGDSWGCGEMKRFDGNFVAPSRFVPRSCCDLLARRRA